MRAARTAARRVVVVAFGLLALVPATGARAAAPHTINFDDATGVIGDAYYDNGALDGARFEKGVNYGFERVASSGAASAPNVAAVPFFPAPRARMGETLSGESNGDVEFPYTHSSVAMTIGRPGTAGDPGTMTLTAYNAGGGQVAQRTVSVPAGSAATIPLAVSSGFSDISKVSFDGDGGGYAIDDFTFDVPDTPPPADFGFSWVNRALSQETVAPGGTTDVPFALTRVNKSSGPISFTATNLPAGVTATFLPDPATDASLHSTEVMRLQAVASPPPVLQQKVVVHAAPSATAGATNRAVVVPVTVKAQFDLRARGIEITQGIQPGGPGEGLPQTPNGDRTFKYAGVKLVSDGFKPTIARFYADAVGAPAKGGASAEATLEGTRNGQPLPDSPLHPDGGGGLLTDLGGDETVTYTERLDDLHPFNFTIPPSWQHGNVKLVAHVANPQRLFDPVDQECAGCGANNVTTLTDIGFTHQAELELDPIKIVYNDQTKPDKPLVEPSKDWYDTFRTTEQVDPVHFLPHYWQGTLDVTTHADKDGKTENFINNSKIARKDKASEINADLLKMAYDNYQLGWPVGIVDSFNLDDGTTDDVGQSTGGPARHGLPRAVINPGRPFTSVSHELGHGLGLQHASGGCGGGSGGETAAPWPDSYGYIRGVGVDFSQAAADGGQYRIVGGNLGYTGADCATKNKPPDCGAPTPEQPYDYMSYCAVDSIAWISAINWDKIFTDYNYGASTSAVAARAAAAKRKGLRVVGFITSSGAEITSVEQGRFAPIKGQAGSTLTATAVNGAGQAIGSSKLQTVAGHTDARGAPEPVLQFTGTVPAAGAKGLRILRQGTEVTSRTASKHAPKVKLLSPKGKSVVGRKKTVAVRWKASDADRNALEVSLEYSANAGRTYRQVYSGPNRAKPVSLPRQYFTHARKARLRITVSDGFNQTTKTSGIFRSLGAPPSVQITQPVRGTIKSQDAPLVGAGFAFNDAGARLTGRKKLTWSYAGRTIGHGATLSAVGLLPGRHRLKLTAKDGTGRKGSASVTVRLTPVQPAFKRLKAPKKISRKAKKVTLKIASTVDTPLKIGKQRFTARRGLTKIKLKVKPGRTALNLTLVLGTGRLTAKRTLTIAR